MNYILACLITGFASTVTPPLLKNAFKAVQEKIAINMNTTTESKDTATDNKSDELAEEPSLATQEAPANETAKASLIEHPITLESGAKMALL